MQGPTQPMISRRTRILSTVAAGSIAAIGVARSSHAQTWLNPTTGSWSVGANWVGGVAPVSGSSTQLTFNATGAQSYSSNNNIAAPFTLNRMTFNNSGSGLITITGQPLAVAGTSPGFVQNGNGPVTINNAIALNSTASTTDTHTISGAGSGTMQFNGAITSSAVPTANNGAELRLDNPNMTVNLAGSSNLFGLTANVGSITALSGTHTTF